MAEAPAISGASDERGTQEIAAIRFVDFLQSVAPGQEKLVEDLSWAPKQLTADRLLALPDIELPCDSERCGGGYRVFRASHARPNVDPNLLPKGPKDLFVPYHCSSCGGDKIFALRVLLFDRPSTAGKCQKIGEVPGYRPRTPARLISLIGPDRELFIKGLRSENHGLGIGAFSYYRRVVERQKDRIFEQIIKVAEKSSARSASIELLRAAQKEIQFTKAIEMVADAFPPSLLIEGQNPLKLLHRPLSAGLHEHGDEQCLVLAHDIRIVLAAFSEKLSEVLKDDAELKASVARLLRST